MDNDLNNKNTTQGTFEFVDEQEPLTEKDTVYTDKETMVRKEYELYIDSNNKEHSDENYNIFKGGWELCEVYMTQVLRYALANKDSLQQESSK
jgi:hypothetical protein|tara:strand:+ start:1731 stop:2009 length:279 start_codon:yes stop_codon:yes gene_type:complete